jgi:hypothetical protein
VPIKKPSVKEDCMQHVKEPVVHWLLFDGEVQLPVEAGGTRCRVTAYLCSDGVPVVVVTELPDNGGVSISLAFDAIAQRVRAGVLRGLREPVWVERWSDRALAEMVLRERQLAADHLMVEGIDGWLRLPLPASVAEQLGLCAGDGGSAEPPTRRRYNG